MTSAALRARAARPIGGLAPIALLALALAACLPTPQSGRQAAVPARLVVEDTRDPTAPWQGNLARPADPDTLADLPGFAPVDLAACGSAPALRPDGRALAVVAGWLESKQVMACNVGGMAARVFDLEAWAWGPPLGLRADYLGHLTWSPDGRRLYVVATDRERSELGGRAAGDEVSRLWVLDPSGARPPASAPLPFAVQRLEAAPDGSAVVALGYRLDPRERSWVALEPPFLALLDPASGAERARIELPGVRIGQRRATGPDGQPEYRLAYPALAIAPDGGRAYLARADEPLLDVIDLRGRRVERTVRTDRTVGLIERLLDLTARPALAKGGPTAERRLALSPDGRWLYVSGSVSRFEPTGRSNEAREVRDWQPVSALETATGQVRWTVAAPGGLTLSPDGRWLYVSEPRFADRPEAPPDAARAGVGRGAAPGARRADRPDGRDAGRGPGSPPGRPVRRPAPLPGARRAGVPSDPAVPGRRGAGRAGGVRGRKLARAGAADRPPGPAGRDGRLVGVRDRRDARACSFVSSAERRLEAEGGPAPGRARPGPGGTPGLTEVLR